MLCDICKQNAATVHLTEIVDDQMTEMHLCETCANEKGAQMESHFGIADLLSGLADLGKQVEEEELPKVQCPNCGLTYEGFRKVGRFGCGECYTTFKKGLTSLLKRIHGSTHHIGKSPVKMGIASGQANEKALKQKALSELQALKKKLQEAIDLEEFEEAARLRDRIRELEKKNK